MPAPTEGLTPDLLAAELARQFTAVLEMMTGDAPIVTFAAKKIEGSEGGFSDPDFLWWEQAFSLGAGYRIWIGASSGSWHEIGKAVLDAAESTDKSPESLRSTFLEIVNQTVSGVAAAISKELQHEVSPVNGRTAKPDAEDGAASFSFDLAIRDTSIPVVSIFSPAWATQPPLDPPQNAVLPAVPVQPAKPKTIDLLLDVELPVSISFGRTQLPLKDVIKLTTGSIVELNRAVTEPVEVIVNNCVIARAEVVVVEGNFGIRIKQVVSRQERLRTLN
jgi:flagellar motor switch protein FliN/FliY